MSGKGQLIVSHYTDQEDWPWITIVKRRTDGGVECTEDGQIGATEYARGNGTRKRGGSAERSEEKGEYGTYNVGVKDLASACVLCPRLAERGGLSIYGRDKGLRNNEGTGGNVGERSENDGEGPRKYGTWQTIWISAPHNKLVASLCRAVLFPAVITSLNLF